MIRALCLACVVGCSPELQTACFDALPDAREVAVRVPEADVEYPLRPQTEAAAESAAWDRMRAMFRDSSDAVRCVIDEGTIACEKGVTGADSLAPGTAYWSCRWHHPEEDLVPAGLRHHVFFPQGVPPLMDAMRP